MKLEDVRNLSKEDLLGAVGLQPKREVRDVLWPSLGLFAVGLAIGAGVGLLLAPRRGAALRAELSQRVAAAKERAAQAAVEATPPV